MTILCKVLRNLDVDIAVCGLLLREPLIANFYGFNWVHQREI